MVQYTPERRKAYEESEFVSPFLDIAEKLKFLSYALKYSDGAALEIDLLSLYSCMRDLALAAVPELRTKKRNREFVSNPKEILDPLGNLQVISFQPKQYNFYIEEIELATTQMIENLDLILRIGGQVNKSNSVEDLEDLRFLLAERIDSVQSFEALYSKLEDQQRINKEQKTLIYNLSVEQIEVEKEITKMRRHNRELKKKLKKLYRRFHSKPDGQKPKGNRKDRNRK